MKLSRRQFVGQVAGAAALPLIARAGGISVDEPSALVSKQPRPLAYSEVKGFLSREQVHWHYESHYKGAIKGFVALDEDPTGSHRQRIAKANSVLLHELYFENMADTLTTPGEATQAALNRRFGQLDRWVEDFRAAAMSCAGWAVLCWHPVNDKLYNVCSDTHDDGPVWSGVPLVVADMYEHSYYLDFQNRKADYVNQFTDHVHWAAVEKRVRALG